MNIFKTIHNGLRSDGLCTLLRELCDGYEDCHDCPAVTFDHRTKQFTCAQINILDQAKEKWSLKKEQYVTITDKEVNNEH